MTALIIDDSRAMRRLLAAYIAPLQAETIQAADGLEALDALRQAEKPVDFALVDWDMPNMNGLEFVQAVRADRRYDGLKMMMVTANNNFESVVKALECGANDYLMKPVTEEMVHDKLRVLGIVA